MQPFAADSSGPPPVGSPSWWKRPERYPITGDGDQDTARIVGLMCDHIKKGADDPVVQHYAEQAVQQFAGIAAIDGDAALPACAWWWCKTYIKFVHHEKLLRRYLGEAGHMQGLISPDALVRMSKPKGDCAIFTSCLLSFLRVFAVPYEIVTVKVDRREPREYSHVFSYAVLPDGRRFPLDASHGDYPGWQVPSRDILFAENETGSPAVQVWDASGNQVADRGSRFGGLGMYGLRGYGLGTLVCDDTGSCYDDGSTAAAADTIWTNTYATGTTPAVPISQLPATAQITVPPQSSPAYAALAAQLIKGGFTLAELNNLQPGTVINPNGQIVRQNPGYAVTSGAYPASQQPAASFTSPFGSASFSSLLPWGIGLVVVGLMFAGGRGR